MGQLAVGAVDLSPRLEQLQDRLALVFAEQPVQRCATRGLSTSPSIPPEAWRVRHRSSRRSCRSSSRHARRRSQPCSTAWSTSLPRARPWLPARLWPGLGRHSVPTRFSPRADATPQPCPVTVARNWPREIFSGLGQLGLLWVSTRRPWRAAASASSAPCFAVRHTVTTVDRSTPYLSAASRCVACPVSTETHNPYFSLAGRCRFGFLPPAAPPLEPFVLLTLGFDTYTDLPVAQARCPLAGY